jgi:hypothetical protein
MGPPLAPSLELPKPPADLRATRKGDKVSLTWTVPALTTDRQNIRSIGSTLICRELDLSRGQCGAPVGEAAPARDSPAASKAAGHKVAANYTDTLPGELEQTNPSGFVTYAVEVVNAGGRGAGLSNHVLVPLVPSLAPLADFAARVTAEGVRISWASSLSSAREANGFRSMFRIYRRMDASKTANKIADIDMGVASAAGSSVFLDQSFEWEKTYAYYGTAVSVVPLPGKADIDVEGNDTPESKVFAHDIFPPAVPSGLQAVFSGPGQQAFIDLTWAPVTDVDLAGYNIYRRENGEVKVNGEPIKTPAYRDGGVVSGKSYLYSVSSVDVRGNESARSEEARERVP